MFVPRVILKVHTKVELESISDKTAQRLLGVHLATSNLDRSTAFTRAQEMKRRCLHLGLILLLDDLEIAALVNADGVILSHGNYNHGRAKDILGLDKLVGATGHRIEDVAEYWEEGMTDFIILESYLDTPDCTNVLGHRQSQTIIDDARIMGYDIPILVAGGVQAGVAQEILQMGFYGVQLERQEDVELTLQYIRVTPLRS